MREWSGELEWERRSPEEWGRRVVRGDGASKSPEAESSLHPN